jgi:hypothetical protein
MVNLLTYSFLDDGGNEGDGAPPPSVHDPSRARWNRLRPASALLWASLGPLALGCGLLIRRMTSTQKI